MEWVDWIIIAAISLSTLSGFMRGAIREIVSLVAWALGVYVAFIYAPQLQISLEPYVETLEFRYAIVFMTVLIVILIFGAILGILFSRLIKMIGLTGLDKSLGIVFGVARGLLLVVIFIMIATYTALPKSSWWASSWFIKTLQAPADSALDWVKNSDLLPEEARAVLNPKPEKEAAKSDATPEIKLEIKPDAVEETPETVDTAPAEQP